MSPLCHFSLIRFNISINLIPQQNQTQSATTNTTEREPPTTPAQSLASLSSNMQIQPTQTAWDMKRGTSCYTLVSLFGDGQLDASTPGQGDVGLGAFADHEDVAQSG